MKYFSHKMCNSMKACIMLPKYELSQCCPVNLTTCVRHIQSEWVRATAEAAVAAGEHNTKKTYRKMKFMKCTNTTTQTNWLNE